MSTINVESARIVRVAMDFEEGVAEANKTINRITNDLLSLQGFKTNRKHEVFQNIGDLEDTLKKVKTSMEGHKEIFESKVKYIEEHEGSQILQKYRADAQNIRANQAQVVTPNVLG